MRDEFDVDDTPFPKPRFTEGELLTLRILLVVTISALIVLLICGCKFAVISKDDINAFHTNFKVYRKYVVPVGEPEKVNRLGDNLEKVLEGWKGGCDAE